MQILRRHLLHRIRFPLLLIQSPLLHCWSTADILDKELGIEADDANLDCHPTMKASTCSLLVASCEVDEEGILHDDHLLA